ncbi:hypothetical protein EGW08_018829 [Elysia chlorotica]|uniref:Uncharacterized protein n=1 Tax=Elysia chlorotica TaxID=188477 RepID=A0A3S1B0U4_ELYCH|nr:hypothetical protein EGW08_018829 [Elysia chlorotica]
MSLARDRQCVGVWQIFEERLEIGGGGCPGGYVYLYGELGLSVDPSPQQPANILGGGKLKVVGGSSQQVSKTFSINKAFDTRVHPYIKPKTTAAAAASTTAYTPTSVSDETSPSLLGLPSAISPGIESALCLPSAATVAAVTGPDILTSAQPLSDAQQQVFDLCLVSTGKGHGASLVDSGLLVSALTMARLAADSLVQGKL